ncbi:Uma2 family endonuclease [Nodularia sp. UHCC 0506]|uniref:Uma2 family endonuclease n=1 Tax=Nodularia sp. UHCC 0506 TaxID=3110243 RepID=UPI002B1EB201|nr:Uma2 family endonuclease [Nodularia sp. UHCC 0506]MEA5514466.1 Uma2 family endonuclease [Nodularia sp. UHCC 0506]
MVNTRTKLTLEEFLNLPEGDVNYEFIDGQSVPKVSPKFFHSTLQAALLVLIRLWCKGKGRVGTEWAVILKRQGQDWVPVPDLTYISYERLPASWKRNEACPAIPELVIEIISPDQTIKGFEEKVKDYLAAGVSIVWVVDPEAISIRVFLPDGSSQVYTDNMLIVNTLLPGLKLTTKQVFEEADLI